jgi:hypothetical protein
VRGTVRHLPCYAKKDRHNPSSNNAAPKTSKPNNPQLTHKQNRSNKQLLGTSTGHPPGEIRPTVVVPENWALLQKVVTCGIPLRIVSTFLSYKKSNKGEMKEFPLGCVNVQSADLDGSANCVPFVPGEYGKTKRWVLVQKK